MPPVVRAVRKARIRFTGLHLRATFSPTPGTPSVYHREPKESVISIVSVKYPGLEAVKAHHVACPIDSCER